MTVGRRKEEIEMGRIEGCGWVRTIRDRLAKYSVLERGAHIGGPQLTKFPPKGSCSTIPRMCLMVTKLPNTHPRKFIMGLWFFSEVKRSRVDWILWCPDVCSLYLRGRGRTYLCLPALRPSTPRQANTIASCLLRRLKTHTCYLVEESRMWIYLR